MTKISFSNKYLLIALIEGSTVMAIEILGAKMLAPFYGSSIFVWTSVIACTLLSLMLGYFAGGRMADEKNDTKTILFYLMVTCAILIAYMPVIATPM
ncbi:MAG: fused MFS/spermidine synthase, partial [Bacteroidetes bacterium]|nr:fused MFS/spermidine synthase [Bacteroidota bacterium]